MELKHLRYFVAIAESASLSEAARRLHIVQPALSKRLADLETEIGVQLLVRGRLGSALTPAGAELYERAKLITSQIDSATEAVRELGSQSGGQFTGHVSIGLLRSIAPAIGGRLFAAMQKRLPEVTPQIRVGYFAELQLLLSRGVLDISMLIQQGPSTSGSPIYSERLCVVATKELFGQRPQHLRIYDLRGLPLLLSSQQSAHRVLFEFAKKHKVELKIIGAMEDSKSLLDVCATGRAACVLSEWAARNACERHGLVSRRLDHSELVRNVVLAVNGDVPQAGKVVVVEELMADVLHELSRDSMGHHHAP
jgi:DNA-binding transcriptional LysR family regulator